PLVRVVRPPHPPGAQLVMTTDLPGEVQVLHDAGDLQLATAPRPLRVDVWRRFRRNKLAVASLIFLLLLVLMAIFADVIAPYSYRERTDQFRAGPSWDHLFGTDRIGRDVFSRIVYGSRVSLKIGAIAT